MKSEYKIRQVKKRKFEVYHMVDVGQSWDGWDETWEDEVVFNGTFLECVKYLELKELINKLK